MTDKKEFTTKLLGVSETLMITFYGRRRISLNPHKIFDSTKELLSNATE
ncbi:hypothetical protein [Dulcicalothrix desertica]|nr:hypothetical protein [Dulcicalothrix desertica]TWH54880.1 hypothetical protein CAL7102_02956 [Dulcicalothrix desertica PCC 7102]